jgi:cation diffusion facilitator CzcD-associated flavoprotein CzcO
LKRAGIDDFIVVERATEVGGTWRDNTYPGCACDVESDLYSFSCAPNPDWHRRYSPWSSIQAYLRRCAERFGILPHIRPGHELRDARWDAGAGRWQITAGRGTFVAEVLILGTGPLSEPTTPPIPGLDSFAGTIFHSARWDHGHDLTGERVAVIGTGASAIQFVPQIQPHVSRLLLYQRTPPWVLPRNDEAIAPRRRALYRAVPLTQRLARMVVYWRREAQALGFVYRPQLLAQAEGLVLRHLATRVPDPVLRAKLTPTYRLGCKRILLSDDFYPAVTQPNVDVITDKIQAISPHGIVTSDGRERAIDTIILATGFHATDAPYAELMRGQTGKSLAETWRGGAASYLGTAVAGFPNLFLLLGPNTGLGHSSMVFMVESQVAYILAALRTMTRQRRTTIAVRPAAQDAYNVALQRRMRRTVWASGCGSWYQDACGRNTTLWPGFTWEYWLRTRRFDARHYLLTPA